MAKNHMKIYWSLFIRKMQIKTTVRNLFTPTKMAIKKTNNNKCCRGCREFRLLRHYFVFNFYWNIVVLQCCICSRGIAKWCSYTYTDRYLYLYSFLDSFPLYIDTRYWIPLSVPYSRSLLVIHSTYSSVYNPILLVYSSCKFVFWFYFCFVNKFICIILNIPHISDIIWYLSFSVWLTLLSKISSRSVHVVVNGIISFFSFSFFLMAE